MKKKPFKVGVSKKKITPLPEMGPVFRAGFKIMEGELLSGVVDDIFLRCLSIETDTGKALFLSFDLLGLLQDFTESLATRVAQFGISSDQLIISTTHSHATPDTMGAFGPYLGKSGINKQYDQFLLSVAVEAIKEAIESSVPTQMYFSKIEKNLGIANYHSPNEIDTSLWSISFRTNSQTIGTLISYTAQPELVPHHDDKISGGYPGEACRILENKIEGTVLFLLGACGGMEPEGCEKGYDYAHSYGKKLATECLKLHSKAKVQEEDNLSIKVLEIELPVESESAILIVKSEILNSKRTLPNIKTKISLIKIGDISIYTIPGESFPGIVDDLRTNEHVLFVNQANDSLGYFITPKNFRDIPIPYDEEGHFIAHELQSLGKKAGEILQTKLLELSKS